MFRAPIQTVCKELEVMHERLILHQPQNRLLKTLICATGKL